MQFSVIERIIQEEGLNEHRNFKDFRERPDRVSSIIHEDVNFES